MTPRLARIWCGWALVMTALCTTQCKWPWEYVREKNLVPAPDPPIVTVPPEDTIIWWHRAAMIIFDWTKVTGAEFYQIDTDSTSAFNSADDNPFRVTAEVDSPPAPVTFGGGALVQRYYGRIRGLSKGWKEGMTEWSTVRSVVMKRQQAAAGPKQEAPDAEGGFDLWEVR